MRQKLDWWLVKQAQYNTFRSMDKGKYHSGNSVRECMTTEYKSLYRTWYGKVAQRSKGITIRHNIASDLGWYHRCRDSVTRVGENSEPRCQRKYGWAYVKEEE